MSFLGFAQKARGAASAPLKENTRPKVLRTKGLVDATGLETADEHGNQLKEAESGQGGESLSSDPKGPKYAESSGRSIENAAQETTSDPVQVALAGALTKAAAAGEWSVVGQLSRELEARRKAHEAPNVVPIRPTKNGGV